MKDSPSTQKKTTSKPKRRHAFDAVIILFLLNLVGIILVVIYIKKINSYSIPKIGASYLSISSIPLSKDLASINASAEAYVVFDTNTRSIIAGKNQTYRFSPASTAKVMTALVALQYYDLDQYLEVPQTVYEVVGSKMHLIPGEQLTVRDLLYGLLLPSGNDAAYVLSYHFPGGVEAFVKEMNKKAKNLKLTNTYFLDPGGYEDGNYTTASELARLGAYGMANKEFARIVGTSYITVNTRLQDHIYELKNLNELLSYDNVYGIKTGFTNEAGGVLLTAVKKGDTMYIVTVLKSQDRFSDTKDLMDFINEKISYSLPTEESFVVGE